jgi:hypothetical protein
MSEQQAVNINNYNRPSLQLNQDTSSFIIGGLWAVLEIIARSRRAVVVAAFREVSDTL